MTILVRFACDLVGSSDWYYGQVIFSLFIVRHISRVCRYHRVMKYKRFATVPKSNYRILIAEIAVYYARCAYYHTHVENVYLIVLSARFIGASYLAVPVQFPCESRFADICCPITRSRLLITAPRCIKCIKTPGIFRITLTRFVIHENVARFTFRAIRTKILLLCRRTSVYRVYWNIISLRKTYNILYRSIK